MIEEKLQDLQQNKELTPLGYKWVLEFFRTILSADKPTFDAVMADKELPFLLKSLVEKLAAANPKITIDFLRWLYEIDAKEREENKQRPIIYLTVHSKEIADEVSDILKKNDIDHLND